MPTLFLFGASEGGLFDFDATLPLMAVQVVLLTFILNALFFKPVGRVVEEREDYVNTSRAAVSYTHLTLPTKRIV